METIERINKMDISYRDCGMFTSFYPESDAGVIVWNEIAKTEPNARILSIHAKSVIAQIRHAGYKVSKAKPIKTNISDVFKELEELGLWQD
jgi:hypothetical protein